MTNHQQWRSYFSRLHKLDKRLFILIVVFLETVIGWLDYMTGPLAPFTHFYLLPIWLSGHFLSGRWAYLMAFFSALAGVPVFAKLVDSFNTLPVLLDFVSGFIVYMVVAYFSTNWRVMLNDLDERATVDALTRSYNRRTFHEMTATELARSARHGHPVSLAFIDLDNFKQVNDTQGHDVGDELLVSATAAIRANLRDGDLLGRLGGDEFAVMFHQTNQEQAKLILPRIKENMLNAIAPLNTNVTFSIGVVTHFPDKPITVDELVTLADKTMYAVKHTSKNAIQFVSD